MKHAQPAAVRSNRERYLTFLLGNRSYAMPVSAVREILRFTALTTVPMTPDFVRGVIHVRGAVLPIMDLSLRLGLPATVPGKRTCAVLLDVFEGGQAVSIAVLVDVVQAITQFDSADLMPRGDRGGQARIPHAFVRGFHDNGSVVTTVLEPASIFSPAELIELLGHASFSNAPT